MAMTRTKSADAYISALARYYAQSVLSPVIAEAERIARERKARRLGVRHLSAALEQLAGEEEQVTA